MARVEADREDLLREAVALVRRMELDPGSGAPLIVAGFRATGWLSIYFTADRMYQFDELGRLRRAFIDGLLYRTQGRVLAQLQRQRSATETALLRRDLEGDALNAFREQAHSRLSDLREQLRAGTVAIVRQFPADDPSLAADLMKFLEMILGSSEFLAPAIKR